MLRLGKLSSELLSVVWREETQHLGDALFLTSTVWQIPRTSWLVYCPVLNLRPKNGGLAHDGEWWIPRWPITPRGFFSAKIWILRGSHFSFEPLIYEDRLKSSSSPDKNRHWIYSFHTPSFYKLLNAHFAVYTSASQIFSKFLHLIKILIPRVKAAQNFSLNF